MKKILMSIMCLMISVMCANATVTNFDNSLTIFGTMPRYGDTTNSETLITINQVSNNFLKVNSATNQSISNSITIGGGTTVTGGTVSNSNGQLILEQTGDTFGPSRLILQNRGGVNGAMFDTTGSAVDLVDFVFNPPSGIKANIRYERRPGYISNPNGDFQLIDGDGVFNMVVGKYTNYFRGYLGIGTTVPSCALDVYGSTVLGYNNTATGLYSIAEGKTSHARGAYSHAEGLSSEAIGEVSHAEGEGSIALATDSHAEGSYGYASGAASHSEGDSTWASGSASHAQNFGTIAAGLGTHAEGGYTIATGRFAHAEGWATHAVGDNSHSEGSNTWANGLQTHAAGANMWVNGTNSFGWSDGTPYTNDTPSNATFVVKNGMKIVGSLTVTGAINQAIVTNTTPITFSASMTNDSITSIRGNSIEIMRGRFYISSTNGLAAPTGVFSQTAELTLANTGERSSGRAIAQYDMGLVCVLLTNAVAAGDTNIYVQDATGFDANSLLFLMGSNEFVRIQSIPSTTNVILKFSTLYGHASTNGVSRVREFGGISYWDNTGSNNLYTTTILPYNTNVNINLDIEYR